MRHYSGIGDDYSFAFVAYEEKKGPTVPFFKIKFATPFLSFGAHL
jgi:hypothetical protein